MSITKGFYPGYRCRGKKQGILTDLSCNVAAPKPWNTLIRTARVHGIPLVEESHISKGKRVTAPKDPNVNETDVFVKKGHTTSMKET